MNIDNEKIMSTIATISNELLISYSLFDVYQGDKLPEGKKSLAYSFVFQHSDRTLEDAEVDTVIKEIIKEISEKCNAELRS